MNSPFDEAKYQALLKGLEVSELMLSEVDKESPSFRFDSSFFQKRFLNSPLDSKYFHIGEKCLVRSGTTPSDREDSLRSGIVLLKTGNIRGAILTREESEDFYFISPELAEKMKKTKLQTGDVLINIVGATTDVIGRVALVGDDFPEANITQAMALLRPESEQVNSAFLFAFLSSKYGQFQVQRIARPTGQYNLNLPEVSSFKIRILSVDFQEAIERSVFSAHSALKNSKTIYAQAETLLLRALDLENWRAPVTNNYTARSGSVWDAARLDAEHFHPQYRAMLDHIKVHAKRCRLVQDFAIQCGRGTQPIYDDEGTLAVVNSKHILENGLDYDNFERTNAAMWNAKEFIDARIQRGDVLTYMTGANVGRTGVYLSDERALASNESNITRIDGENSIYVAVALNSMVGRMQVERAVTGSAQAHLYPSDIRQFIVPFVAPEIESEIVACVESSHAAKRRAKALLERAKRAVEVAIEDDEAAGLSVLEEAN